MKKVAVGAALISALLVALPAAGAPNPIAEAAQVITGAEIKNNTITGKDVRNRSLTRRDFRGSVRGAPGPRGAQGVPGPQGPAGPTVVGRIVYVERSFSVAPGGIDIQGVACPPGYRVVSGGFTIIGADSVPFVDKSYSGAEWSIGVDNFNAVTTTADTTAHAWCAPAGQAVAATAGRSAVSSLRARDERRQRAKR